MTIQERQEMKDRLAAAEHFERDYELFVRVFPRHNLQRELRRVNKVNALSLDKQMVYILTEKVSEEEIRENRREKEGELCGAKGEREERKSGSDRENGARKVRTKQEEFKGIDWDDNQNTDIQLCILLYDERVKTYHRMVELDGKLEGNAEAVKEFAEMDERNRLAQKELEVYESTRVFPQEHPIARDFLADRETVGHLTELKEDMPAVFMQRVTNNQKNISRIKSRLNKQQYKSEEEKGRWEKNLQKALHLQALMERVI